MSVALRPAAVDDAPFVAALVSHPDVAPFLAAVRAATVEEVRAEIERALAEPDACGVLVIEADGRPVGTVAWERVNRRSRIVSVGGLAVDPGAHRSGVASGALHELVPYLLGEKGFHRVQLEVYGFNERAAALFERAGFTREGVRRKAYLRGGEWVDGILFGLVEEDRAGR
jgi:putative acetyltransferase